MKWVAIGDSITLGNGPGAFTDSYVDYVQLDGTNPFSTIVNAGVGGSTALTWDASLLAGVPTDADVYSIMLGTNDLGIVTEGLPAFIVAITSLITRIKAFGSPRIVILAPMFRGEGVDPSPCARMSVKLYNLAQAQAIHFYDTFGFTKALCGGDEAVWVASYSVDGLHPTNATSALAEAPIITVLKRAANATAPSNIAPVDFIEYAPDVLLLHFNAAADASGGLRDATGRQYFIGGIARTVTNPKFGVGCADVNGSVLSRSPPDYDFNFSGVAFRLGMWLRTVAGAGAHFVHQLYGGGYDFSLTAGLFTTNGCTWYDSAAIPAGLGGNITVNDGLWHWVELLDDGAGNRWATVDGQIDAGAMPGSQVGGPAWPSTQSATWWWGSGSGGGNRFTGALDELRLRLVLDVTPPFTAPTAEFVLVDAGYHAPPTPGVVQVGAERATVRAWVGAVTAAARVSMGNLSAGPRVTMGAVRTYFEGQ